MQDLLISIFCDIYDFCKEYDQYLKTSLLIENTENKYEFPKSSMCLSEVMCIVTHFHLSNFRTFKSYYIECIQGRYRKYFPKAVSYNRFLELMEYALFPLLLYTLKFKTGKCTGISFIDSTTLDVCDSHRIHCNKVFKGLAKRGKSSTGWFYGFKLHLIINDKGEILSFCITSGNVDDRNLSVIEPLSRELFGKLFADKGYISQKVFDSLFSKGITLVTKIKKNMKNKLMNLYDKVILRKRAVIESVNDFLKNICQIEHSRHRKPLNFLVNLVAGIAAYSFLPKKPSLKLDNLLFSL